MQFPLCTLEAGTVFHWLIAVSLTLLILDLFICTEFLSWIALVLFALYGTWLFDLPAQWSVLVFLVCLALEFTLYYTLWAKAVRPLIASTALRHAPDDIHESPTGRAGSIIRADDGSFCVKVADLLYPVHEADHAALHGGERVLVTELVGGIARVQKI